MANVSLKLKPLTNQERAAHGGFTHSVVVRASDLTETTANTAQTIDIGTILTGDWIHKLMLVLTKPFRDKSDAAFNSTGVIVGDTGDDNRFITTQQVNKNGPEITAPVLSNTAYGPYTADDKLQIAFAAMALKSLADLDEGELCVLVSFPEPTPVAQCQGDQPITGEP